MTMKHSIHSIFMAIVFLLGVAGAVEVNVTLDSQIVQAGEAANLSIRVSGGQPAKPQIPEVKNLTVQYQGQSTQISIINGQRETSLAYNYIIGSSVAGEYQIPPVEVTVGGQKYLTKGLKLTVLASGQAQAAPNAADLAKEEADPRRFGFLTLELANQNRKHAYLGEIAPVRINAWLPKDSKVSLRSGIQPESKGFTLQNVSQQPQQHPEVLDGKQYQVLTWFGGISAAKAGTLPASLSLKAVVAVPDLSKPALRQRRSGPFDDPFFDDAFNQRNMQYIEKEVTLTSQDQNIEVRPLPTEGRPDSFTGAVGEFEFEAIEIPTAWKTGEPQKVALRLKGSGNFSSLKAPALSPADLWTSYPGQDQFTPGDYASFAGAKVFQYNALIRKHGKYDVGFAFSYFDPDQGQYKEIKSQAVNIQVTGDDIAEENPADANKSTAAPAQVDRPSDQAAPPREKESSVRLLKPLYQRSPFLYGLVFLGLATLVGPVSLLYWKFRDDPQRRARKALRLATSQALQSAEKCAANGDVPGFFAAARSALQDQLGGIWKQAPQAITVSEVQSRLGMDSPVTAFFRAADHQSYGGMSAADSLPQWRSLLQQCFALLTAPDHQ